MTLSPLNIGSQKDQKNLEHGVGVSQQCRLTSTEKHPNTPSQEMQEKEMKTLIARKQAFTWIHRNSLSQKIQENCFKYTEKDTIFSESSSNGEH